MAVKMVGAGPLTRGAYDQWKGQDSPVSCSPDDDGYIVQYYGVMSPGVQRENLKDLICRCPNTAA